MIHDAWTAVAVGLALVASVIASGHAVLHKRDVRAALGWVVFIWLAPVIGAGGYVLLGVNRIRRRGQALRQPLRGPTEVPRPPLPPGAGHLEPMVQLADNVVRRPLVAGNAVDVLDGGARAYPAMLAAIDEAERSVTLATYLFDPGSVGETFATALARARERGVAVRVLVDAVGARYRWPPITRRLEALGVRHALFLPRLRSGWTPVLNLRNHRKILVVDGRVGFTGGLNIRDDFLSPASGAPASMDLHARLEGPIVAQLQAAFAEDWQFTTGEALEGPAYLPPLPAAGPVLARSIPDGPDEDFETIRWILLGALAAARRRVRIVTPYFLPDQPLLAALDVAALRGVEVEVVLPERGNLPVVQWAQTAQLWQVIARGCRVWLTPPPFDHAKALTVDGAWSLFGSANWDPRSLRLNFELCVEAFDPALAARVDALVDARLARARPVTMEALDGRALPVKLRDGVARLFSPYL